MDILPATGAIISVISLSAAPPRMRKSDFGVAKLSEEYGKREIFRHCQNSRKATGGNISSQIRPVFPPPACGH